MTVLSGGISGGHLWERVKIEGSRAGLAFWAWTYIPMLPMTAEDLGGMTDELTGAVWPDAFPRYCVECLTPGECFGKGECQLPDF